jgi:hypothetical protein
MAQELKFGKFSAIALIVLGTMFMTAQAFLTFSPQTHPQTSEHPGEAQSQPSVDGRPEGPMVAVIGVVAWVAGGLILLYDFRRNRLDASGRPLERRVNR